MEFQKCDVNEKKEKKSLGLSLELKQLKGNKKGSPQQFVYPGNFLTKVTEKLNLG